MLLFLATGTPIQAHEPLADTLKVQKFLAMGQSALAQDSLDAANSYFLAAETLSREIGYSSGISSSLRDRVMVLDRQGKYKEALAVGLKAIEASKDVSQDDLAKSYNHTGIIYYLMGNLEAAATSYLSALKIAKGLDDVKAQIRYCSNLSTVFAKLGEKEKHFYYAKESYQLAKQSHDTLGMVIGLSNMASSQTEGKNYDDAARYAKEALQLAELLKNSLLVLECYTILGETELKRENYQIALNHYQQGIQLLHYNPVPRIEATMFLGIARAYMNLELSDQAAYYFKKGISIAQQLSNSIVLLEFYELGTQLYEKRQETLLALNYHKKLRHLNDSLLNTQTQQSIYRMEIEYQTAQKEKEIVEQNLMLAQNQLDIQKKNNLIYLSLVALILLLSGILFFYMRYRTKQKVNAQRLQALRQEGELKELMARIEGEEKERSRLARELHDGVGGILSATKMHLSVLQHELEEGQAQKFEHTSSLLDTASQEIRTIAHNLSPDMLIRYELDQALAKFCKTVSNASLQVDFYYLGEPVRLKSNFKLVLYRMVQELVNNIIKHAGASQALVQLSLHDHMLSLTVEDNGVGFDLKESKGLGLANLQARVKDMQGELSLESASGRGTTIYAEFDITPFREQEGTLRGVNI